MRASLVALGLVLTLCACDGRRSGLPIYELSGQTMGTTFSVKLVTTDDDFDQAALGNDVSEVLARVDDRMSTWKSGSELSLFNATSSTDWINVSQEFCDVIEAALVVSNLTSGAFDITVGPLVNLWGFGPAGNDHTGPPSDKSITENKATSRVRATENRLRHSCGPQITTGHLC